MISPFNTLQSRPGPWAPRPRPRKRRRGRWRRESARARRTWPTIASWRTDSATTWTRPTCTGDITTRRSRCCVLSWGECKSCLSVCVRMCVFTWLCVCVEKEFSIDLFRYLPYVCTIIGSITSLWTLYPYVGWSVCLSVGLSFLYICNMYTFALVAVHFT